MRDVWYNQKVREMNMIDFDMNDVLRRRTAGESWRTIGASYAEAGENPAVIGERIRGRYRLARSAGLIRSADGTEVSVNTVADAIDYTPEELLRIHGYDPERFELVDSSAYTTDTGVRTRIKVRERLIPSVATAFIEAVKNASEDFNLMTPPEKTHTLGTLIIPLFDIHFGKNTVGSGMDPRMWLMSMLAHVDYLKKAYDTAIILIGQDTFNADTYRLTTTKGTPMRQYQSAEKMYEEGFEAILAFIRGVNALIPNVEVIYTYGNHDRLLGYTMAVGLRAAFEDKIPVRVYDKPRVYFTANNVLVGVTHGDDLVSLSGVMASEARDLWSFTDEKVWIKGHLHHLSVDEKDGVTVIGVPSPSIQDEWHRDKGYLAHPRGCLIGLTHGHLKEIVTVGAD